MKQSLLINKFVLAIFISFVIVCKSGAEVNTIKRNGAFPDSPVITPFFGKYWMLVNDFTYKIEGTNEKIIVPAGFVTDLASVPNAFKGLFDKAGRYAPAGIIHDYMYWGKMCNQIQADRVLKYALISTGVGKPTAKTIYLAVKTAKKLKNIPWKDYTKERLKRLPRVIPKEYRDFPLGVKWKKYQNYLFEKGVASKELNIEAATYCKLFDKK